MIPVFVVTGFLGAGKTTLLSQISGEIPGGQYIVQIGDAIFNFIRRYIGPIVVGLVFMAALIGGLERDRASLLARADAALSYAQGHDFAAEFDARMRHLAQAFSRSGRSASAAGQPRHGLAGS